MIDLENLDWSRSTYPPFEHQVSGVKFLISNRFTGLLDEMGTGKTKQIIDTACFLYEDEEIDTVLIMCPAQVKDVWAHPIYSQIIEHSWVKGIIHEFTSRTNRLPTRDHGLLWVISSVELLRQKAHVDNLLGFLRGRDCWAVVDESSTISNPKASQTKGVLRIGPSAVRRTIANGTPVGQSLLGLFSQFQFVDIGILGYKNFFAFRNRHARMGGWMNKQVVGFYDLERVQLKIKPYVVRRLRRDCLDLPERLNAPLREVKLTLPTWLKYVQMREELVAYLKEPDGASIVSAAPIKALRLSQICSGFLGGVTIDDTDETSTVEISSELTDDFLDYYECRLAGDSTYKLIVWARFRPEIARLERRLRERFPKVLVRVLQGGLSKSDREAAVTLFHPDAPDPPGAAVLIGQPQAGRFGLNFTKCSNVDRISADHSYLTWSQSNDRVDRPGQKSTMIFQDYVVVGPNRERTMSGLILKAIREHEDVANWTCSRWITELVQENADDIPW